MQVKAIESELLDKRLITLPSIDPFKDELVCYWLILQYELEQLFVVSPCRQFLFAMLVKQVDQQISLGDTFKVTAKMAQDNICLRPEHWEESST